MGGLLGRTRLDGMHDPRDPHRNEGERYPSRRLSSIGAGSTGWRSSLETNPHQSFGSFVGQLLIAGGIFALIALALTFFGS
jgi:hypothetical protein